MVDINTYPAFVTIGGIALQRYGINGDTVVYHRHAGMWDAFVKRMDDGRYVCSNNKGPMSYINGEEVKECTQQEWEKDNVGYIIGVSE